jgi:Rieske Fe-S protein
MRTDRPLDRREFIVVVGGSAVLAAATRGWSAAPATTPSSNLAADAVVDAGPITALDKDGVFDAWRDQGLFVIRRDGRLFALSSVCTHKGCKVRGQEDGTYLCKCHGSTFDHDGKVTKGPATKNLPRLAVATDTNMHLQVDLSQKFEAGHFDDPR